MEIQQSSTSIFESKNFSSYLSEKLLSFSETQLFSDICITASDGVQFHAHKCVLSACSDYFLTMFASGLKESLANEVKILEFNGMVFKPILKFLYMGRIELKSETIGDILRAANFFQIQTLLNECYKFMADELDVKNCLNITMFADQNGLIELFKKSLHFASSNFEAVCSCPDFLDLDEDQLNAIVSSEYLCVTSEEKVFFNIIKWIEHDKENRGKSAFNLISKVRYWLLSLEFIKQHRSKLPHHVEYLEIVCNWLEWHSSPDGRRAIKPMEFSKPSQPHGLMIVGGGGIKTYDADLDIWSCEFIPNLPFRFDKIVAFQNKLIFSWLEKPLTCFDFRTQEITILPRMHVQRRSYGMAVMDNELYVIGGQKYLSPWKRVVEKFNFSTGKWYDVCPMNTIFSTPKVAVANGKLYVVGDKSPTMECLTPGWNEWTSKPIVGVPKSAFGFTEVAGELYKVGGAQYNEARYGKDVYFKCIQGFNTSENIWTQREQMKIALTDPHCIAWNDRLITCGGRDETGTSLNLVQEYNPSSNEWRTLAQMVEHHHSNDYALVGFK